MRRNKCHHREGSKRGGCLKWFVIGFVVLIFMALLGGGGSTDTTTQNFATTTTEEERLANKEKWQENLDNARTDVTYDNLMRKPDDYFGEIVQYSGTVIQTITVDGTVKQRVALFDDYDKIVLIEYREELPETRLLDDDYITFTGLAFGTITYETVLGSTLEIPLILASSIDLEQKIISRYIKENKINEKKK